MEAYQGSMSSYAMVKYSGLPGVYIMSRRYYLCLFICGDSHQDDLPQRRCLFQPAPDGDSHNACLGCRQQDQQHEGRHDSLVHAVTAEAESDVRHSLEVSHHINGARWVPCEVHSGIPACHVTLSD